MSNSEAVARSSDLSVGYVSALLACGALYFGLVVRVLGRWWFQDDAGHFAAVVSVRDPLTFFTDLGFARHFGSGRGVVPMQMLSYWLDTRLHLPQPFGAYLHGFLASLAALVALFFVLRRVSHDDRLAFAGAVVWMLLPSTLATCLFISTRHYVEGLVFAAVAFCLASSPRLSVWGWFGLALASAAAMLSKETYAAFVPAVLFALGVVQRDRVKVAASVLLVAAYALYRLSSVGGGMGYVMPLLDPGGYLKYLVTTPYTFASTLLGYPIVLAILVGTILYARQGGAITRRDLCVLGVVLAATLFVLYPVAYAVVNNYRTPGPWLRSPFLPNTISLVWIVRLAGRLLPRERSLIPLALLALALVPGDIRSLGWWNEHMTQEETEGRFALAHPDRLLYSPDLSYWYFDSLRDWYRAPMASVVLAERPDPAAAIRDVRRYGVAWSYQGRDIERGSGDHPVVVTG